MCDLLIAPLRNKINDVWLMVPVDGGVRKLPQVKVFVWSQNVRMVRILFPDRSRSNPSFIFSKGKTWVINGSNGNFLAIKSATSLGTESLLLKPEKKITSLLFSKG